MTLIELKFLLWISEATNINSIFYEPLWTLASKEIEILLRSPDLNRIILVEILQLQVLYRNLTIAILIACNHLLAFRHVFRRLDILNCFYVFIEWWHTGNVPLRFDIQGFFIVVTVNGKWIWIVWIHCYSCLWALKTIAVHGKELHFLRVFWGSWLLCLIHSDLDQVLGRCR